MNSKFSCAALAALLLAAPALADDKPAPAPTARESVMTFFKHLKEALSTSAVQGERKRAHGASVAAVRGAGQASPLADPNEPVLIGDARSKRDKALMAEDAEFAKAVDLILAGKTADGVKSLEQFKTSHPKSRSLDRVQQAINEAKLLNQDKGAAVSVPPAPAETAAAASAAPVASPNAAAPAEASKPDAIKK
jgi:hypothetical protein